VEKPVNMWKGCGKACKTCGKDVEILTCLPEFMAKFILWVLQNDGNFF